MGVSSSFTQPAYQSAAENSPWKIGRAAEASSGRFAPRTAALRASATSPIFPLHHGAIPAFVVFQSSAIPSDSIRHKSKEGEGKKRLPNQFHGGGIYLSTCVLAWNHSRRRAALSLKQLIHGSITKAAGLIEMFSHFSAARRRLLNHSPVVYSEISFAAALFFTAGPAERLPPKAAAVLLH